VAQVRIPWFSRRVNAIGSRKCRSEVVVVESIQDGKGKYVSTACGWRNNSLIYRVGGIVGCGAGNFDGSMLVECAPGIHFFMTRQEAEDWAGQ
jgi:hypothetical protein